MHKSSPKCKLCNYNSADYIFLASTIALALGEEFNETDLDILAAFFAILADELALISSLSSCPNSNDDFVSPVPPVTLTRKKRVKKFYKTKLKK